jgi:predicted NBD/HSP70 family sugar kinase
MCANITLTTSAEKIVLGGGIMNRGEVLLSKIRLHYLKIINGYLKH